MTEYVTRAGLQVAEELAQFVETRALPGTGLPSIICGKVSQISLRASCRKTGQCWQNATSFS